MDSLIGRDAEFRVALDVLNSARRQRVCRALRIAGPSGIGKTTLLQAVAQQLKTDGWVVATVSGYRLQASLPLFGSRRLLASLLDTLSSHGERYVAGLETELGAATSPGSPDATAMDGALFRLLEGITIDHPVAFIVDDAQWIDRDSRAHISRTLQTLADRVITLISAERSDEAGSAAFEFQDASLPLGKLSRPASAEIVRSRFPNANGQVLESIVAHAAGHAVDLVALTDAARENGATSADDVAANMRSLIAGHVALLPEGTRQFLQICSLMSDPIDYSVLNEMWKNDAELHELITTVSRRYLVRDGNSLHFAHAAIAQAVRETVAIEIPFRRRIIDAITALESLRLEDYERLVEQAARSGNRKLERTYLVTLAEEAGKVMAFDLVSSASERALAIAQPAGEEVIPFYSRLAVAYNATGRASENVALVHNVLQNVSRSGPAHGLGGLVASVLLAQWHVASQRTVNEVYDTYFASLTDPADRVQLLSFAAFRAMNLADVERFELVKKEVAGLENVMPPLVRVRMIQTEALLKSRLGDYEAAHQLIAVARSTADTLMPAAAAMPRMGAALTDFFFLGVNGLKRVLEQTSTERKGATDVIAFLQIIAALAIGDFEDVSALSGEALVRHQDSFMQRMVTGALATAHALAPEMPLPTHVSTTVERNAQQFVNGDDTNVLLVAALAWAGRSVPQDRKPVEAILERALARLRTPIDPIIFVFPTLITKAAHAIGRRDILQSVAALENVWIDRQPWNQAHWHLAAGLAERFLGARAPIANLTKAANLFDMLGASFFATVARNGLAESHDRGGSTPTKNDLAGEAKTTRREREVAALVAEGMSNREIAEKLVLSERTVEAHIGNLFAKVNVNSRTQLAAWYIRAMSSVAYKQ